MKLITVNVEGKSLTGFAERIGDGVWVHLDGRTFLYEPPKKETRVRGKAKGAATGDVLAPMPGKIIKVLVKPGENAEAQSVLLVMEAMKMEYTLKAPMTGKVVKVACNAGDQVTLGQLLVKVEPADVSKGK